MGVPAFNASSKPVTRFVAPGPQRRIDEADLARNLGIGICRKHPGSLVIDQMVLETQSARRIIERQQLKAAHSKHRAALERLDHARDRLAARHLIDTHTHTPNGLWPHTLAKIQKKAYSAASLGARIMVARDR